MAEAGAVLFGRALELERLANAIEAACSGSGRLVVVEGPAGIGKSALLEQALEAAAIRSVRALRSAGSELETHQPFGVVRQLFDAVLAAASDSERQAWFAGAAELAAPVLVGEQRSGSSLGRSPDDLFGRLHGLYWFVAGLSDQCPVVLVVDDAHWADEPSLSFIGYLGRRLTDLPISVIVGTRPPVDAPAALRSLLADVPDSVARLRPLDRDEVADVVRGRLGAEFDAAIATPCHEATGGNPFLLGELLREVDARGLGPAGAAREVVALAPDGVINAIGRRLARLPAEVGEVANALAVLDDGVGLARVAEVAQLGTERVAADALTLHREGIVAGDGQTIRFSHPIMRVTVHSTLNEVERALLHYRAASVLLAHGHRVDEVAVHLLHSPVGLDDSMLRVLRDAASEALNVGAPDAAARALRRLVRELPAGDERDSMLLELGIVGGAAGFADADEHLGAVIARHDHGPIRDRATLELARVRKLRGQTGDAVALLGQVVDIDGVEPAIGEEAWLELLGLGCTSRSARRLLEGTLQELVDPGSAATTMTESFTLGLMAFDRARVGDPSRATVVEMARRALAYPMGFVDAASARGLGWLLAAVALMWSDELDEAFKAHSRMVDDAHTRGAAVALSMGWGLRALVEWRRGEVADAELDARRAVELARELPAPHSLLTAALATTGLVALQRSDDPAGLAAAEQELLDERHDPDGTPFALLVHARGLLRLGQGDIDGGVALLLETGEIEQSWGAVNPAVVPWRSDAARALLLLDRVDEATALARDELHRARRFGAARAIGIALGAVAAVTKDPERRLVILREAVDVLARSVARLDHARALIELGAEVRRRRQVSDAREILREGEELAFRCGATVLGKRARAELLASGARPRRAAVEGAAALTPSEHRVAELAAAGHTNRIIAQQLFVSQKTVETHLSHVFTKLSVQSRRQIADALAG
jgi:DNA-binding CsgD family transcriptional regulator